MTPTPQSRAEARRNRGPARRSAPGAHRRPRGGVSGRVSIPSVTALTVGVVALGAAGASALDVHTAPTMSLAHHGVATVASARPLAAPTTPTARPPQTVAPKATSARPVVAAARWTCPIAGCGGRFTSAFGARWGSEHLGDDFATPVGTALHAMHDATVVAAGAYGGMGERIELDLGGGVHAVYAHLSRIGVSVGQRVSVGQVVGRSGNTGHSTGPHLHLEIHRNGEPVDPAPWLRSHRIF